MRRKGQSLAFREFAPYAPGDDIRHVDWLASVRSGGQDELLVRRYAAEEQLTLVVSVDCRETMMLPEAFPKYSIACWLAEALATMTAASGDKVVLHRLFGTGGQGLFQWTGRGGGLQIRRNLAQWAEQGTHPGTLNLKPLNSQLPPTAVWLVVTDLYFTSASELKALAGKIDEAQRGLCWVILLDLDSWLHEKAYLGLGPRHLEGPGRLNESPRFDIDVDGLNRVKALIEDHKYQFYNLLRQKSLDRMLWSWPDNLETDAGAFFRGRFLHEPVLQRLFMRD